MYHIIYVDDLRIRIYVSNAIVFVDVTRILHVVRLIMCFQNIYCSEYYDMQENIHQRIFRETQRICKHSSNLNFEFQGCLLPKQFCDLMVWEKFW